LEGLWRAFRGKRSKKIKTENTQFAVAELPKYLKM